MAAITDDYLVSAKIIEFFWLLIVLIQFILVVAIRIHLKKEIHVDVQLHPPQAVNSDHSQANLNPEPNKPHDISEEQIGINIEVKQPQAASLPQQNNQQQNSAAQLHKIELISLQIDNMVSKYLPQLTISILSINNWASYPFSTACVMLFWIFTFLFNEFEVHKNMSPTLQTPLKLSNHIFIICLCINYLVVSQN